MTAHLYSQPCTRQLCTTNWDVIRATSCITECTITNAAAAAAAADDDDDDEDAYKRWQLERCSN